MRNRAVVPATAVVLCAAAGLCCAGASGQSRAEHAYFTEQSVNAGLEPLEPPPNLETPQGCIENFILSARRDDWRRAARSLNFRLTGDVDEQKAQRLAAQLFYVLNQELWIDWDALPDRADGLIEGDLLGESPMSGVPRRSIRLGSIEVGQRSIPIRVQRVKPEQGEPIWLISAQTVDNITLLHEAHGPTWLAQQMPSWARMRSWLRVPLWQWVTLALVLMAGPVVGIVLGRILSSWIGRMAPGRAATLAETLRWPMAVVIATIVIYIGVAWAIPLPSAIGKFLDPLVLIAVVFGLAWVAMRIISFLVEYVAKGAVLGRYDDHSARRKQVLTQITVARYVVMVLVAVVAVSAVLMQLELFRTLGIALLSSAGAAAVVLGIAGHAVLGNLIAGLQIALTHPFRIGDTVYVEDNWGRIEDITYTYVTVKTWDERRMVMPIKYFVSNYIENWSKTDDYLVKPIYLHLDYTAEVQRIRSEFLKLLRADDRWAKDRDDPQVLVIECNDDTMVVRLTCGGADPSDAWQLSCSVREQLIAWLQEVEGGTWLPRHRVLMAERSVDGSPGQDSHGSNAPASNGGAEGDENGAD